jgi:sugar phosphate permease
MKQDTLSFDKSLIGPQTIAYRWIMLALLWLIYASFGMINRSISPLVTPILTDLKMSYSQMGLVLGSWQLTYIVAATTAGFFLDKWGIRRSLLFGIIVIALSVGLRYFSQGFGSFLPIVALFGIGGPMISVGCPKTIALWFRGKERGTAIGIYMTGPWLGGAFALAATNRLIMPLTGYSWRMTFAFFGLIALVIASLWWFLARDLEMMDGSERIGMKSVFMRLAKVRNVQVIIASGLLAFAIFNGLTNWLPKILESKGFSPTLAGYASSTPLLAGIPSLLIIPRIIPPFRRGAAITITALIVALSVWMSFTLTGVSMFAGLILYGISACILIPLMMLILMETPEVGPKLMGSAGGLFFSISEIGGFMSPLVVGMLFDWTGDFLSACYFIFALSLAIVVLNFRIHNKTALESKSC